jgi:indole-3-glycerol phosphate synthase
MSFLDDLLTSTRARVAAARRAVSAAAIQERAAAAGPARGLRAALAGPAISLVAEIKRATPSLGDIAAGLDAGSTAHAYARGGASALSVLTEPEFFKGSLEDLHRAASAGLPVLRKDFVVDPYQVFEARAAGADAVLVIVRIAPGRLLDELFAAARLLRMDVLAEVYDENDLDRAVDAGARLIGINHRDLATFEVDRGRTAKLAPMVPPGVPVVAFSGVSTRAEVVAMADAGASAVLVGESLVRAADPEAKVRELLGR